MRVVVDETKVNCTCGVKGTARTFNSVSEGVEGDMVTVGQDKAVAVGETKLLDGAVNDMLGIVVVRSDVSVGAALAADLYVGSLNGGENSSSELSRSSRDLFRGKASSKERQVLMGFCEEWPMGETLLLFQGKPCLTQYMLGRLEFS